MLLLMPIPMSEDNLLNSLKAIQVQIQFRGSRFSSRCDKLDNSCIIQGTKNTHPYLTNLLPNCNLFIIKNQYFVVFQIFRKTPNICYYYTPKYTI